METILKSKHMLAGAICGEEKTCGSGKKWKIKLDTINDARYFIAEHYGDSDHGKEPYPCAFCGKWHIGRIMAEEELDKMIMTYISNNSSRPYMPWPECPKCKTNMIIGNKTYCSKCGYTYESLMPS